MIDPPTNNNINEVNSDIKEFEENLVSSSNMPIDYIVDKNLDIIGPNMSPWRLNQRLMSKIPPTLFKSNPP